MNRFLLPTLALVWAGACGGGTFETQGDPGGGGSTSHSTGGGAGASSGGSSSHAGGSTRAGTGGSEGLGGVSGSMGAGGSKGPGGSKGTAGTQGSGGFKGVGGSNSGGSTSLVDGGLAECPATVMTGGCIGRADSDAGLDLFMVDGGRMPVIDARVTGTIDSISNTLPAGSCLGSSFSQGYARDLMALRLVDGDGAAWNVEFTPPNLIAPFHVGDTVTAHYYNRPGGFGPDTRRLSVSSGGQVLVFVFEGGSLDEIAEAPQGMSFLQGAPLCETVELCGTWRRYALTVTSGGTVGTVMPGQAGSVTGYATAGGDFALATYYGPSCADWFVKRIAFAMIARPPGI